MAYRKTPKVQAQQAAQRQRLLDAATALVAEGGFNAMTIAATAERAGVATGTVYKHFTNKGELCAELFRCATEVEVEQVRSLVTQDGSAAERLRAVISNFAARALRGQRLAYALIAEPVGALVEAERLHYRRSYATLFQSLIQEGIDRGEFAAQDAGISASALVGIIAETLVGPLNWHDSRSTPQAEHLVPQLQAVCLRALGTESN
ncbi:TetR/AcrR family transcriptional regulator [Motiliproteus coralliicola]|uniref:TetR/AcrR family transcriptional regulator n=1 Tax=Motiliproteus coralliicola TaxID=2283196 RepID=A0A369WQK9_9GAMM|nr:TetR/AcrR family transcriptional regulator [Motiliproteus coralliicola]RDE24360.1 TetR/AcrR family transcriptional regulator [Motiliproteus coralliicola]